MGRPAAAAAAAAAGGAAVEEVALGLRRVVVAAVGRLEGVDLVDAALLADADAGLAVAAVDVHQTVARRAERQTDDAVLLHGRQDRLVVLPVLATQRRLHQQQQQQQHPVRDTRQRSADENKKKQFF